MKSIQLKNKIGGAILAFSILFGIGIASSVTAQAQWRNDDSYGRDRNRDWRRDRNRDRDRDDDWNRDRRRNDNYGRNGGYGNYGGYGGYNNIYRVAQSNGYQAGLNTGANDAQRGQSYNPQRSHYYQNATYGYNSSYGSKGQYKQAYRDGFLQGYQQGYQRYGGYGNNGGYGYPRRSRTGSILGEIFGRP